MSNTLLIALMVIFTLIAIGTAVAVVVALVKGSAVNRAKKDQWTQNDGTVDL